MSDFSQFFLANSPSFPEAQCKDMENPDLFFPETREEMTQVLPMIRKTCGLCIHQADCLKYALDNGIEEGIWGGMTSAERKRIKPRTKRRYTSDLGERVDRLRKEGLRFPEIAERLGHSIPACQQAHYRYKQRQVTA